MALGQTAAWAIPTPSHILARAAAVSTRNIRTTVLLSLILICGSFATAATLQMQRDSSHAVSQATAFEAARSREIAAALDAAFDRYAELGRSFAHQTLPPGDFALSQTQAPALKNIAVLDDEGETRLALREGRPRFLPLPDGALDAARTHRVLVAEPASVLIAFPVNDEVVLVELDPAKLLPATQMARAALATSNGAVLAESARWISGQIPLPPRGGTAPVSAVTDGHILVSAARTAHWPALAATSLDRGTALAAWYGSLPLYLFVILGPALVGAALAAIFVREFERRVKANEAIRALRAVKPSDAKILVKLADAERRAVEAERSRAEFVAHMSHELRTPLNAIIGFAEIIEHGLYGDAGHPKYIEYAHDIGTAGRGLHARIGDILEFANVEAGRYPVAMERFDLSELAYECVNAHVGRAFSRRITLEVGFAEPIEVTADPHAVRRILANLIVNALSYTAGGGFVRIDVRNEEGSAIVSVYDTGLGFSEEEAKKVGTPFIRFDRPGGVQGSGLGLAVAMALAHRMNGAVRVGGVRGEGSWAELRLAAS
ncbi:MAG TPA: HAMP domain-containing sensor histidine kinase [Rhizomicrobium sp.]|jgi:signal transduction histidine kinase